MHSLKLQVAVEIFYILTLLYFTNLATDVSKSVWKFLLCKEISTLIIISLVLNLQKLIKKFYSHNVYTLVHELGNFVELEHIFPKF